MTEPRPAAPLVSVVIPLYNEELNVEPLVKRLEHVLRRTGSPWELVFALDPSPDRTRERLLELMEQGYPIRLLIFSRRIGKPLSLLAGLDHAVGDVCVIIDADLQDPPELIEAMLATWRDGYDVVIPQRVARKGEHFLYLKAAELFYWLLEKISEVPVPRNTGDFRLLDARVVREVCRFRERHGFLRGMTALAGFKTALLPYERDARHAGRTQIPLRGAVNIALDGIVPFSRAPVRWMLALGLIFVLLAVGSGLAGLTVGLLSGMPEQWPIWFACWLNLMLSGIVLSGMGILGEYLVRTYEEARHRPLYIVHELHEADSLPRSFRRPC